jgi:hypothetical protein
MPRCLGLVSSTFRVAQIWRGRIISTQLPDGNLPLRCRVPGSPSFALHAMEADANTNWTHPRSSRTMNSRFTRWRGTASPQLLQPAPHRYPSRLGGLWNCVQLDARSTHGDQTSARLHVPFAKLYPPSSCLYGHSAHTGWTSVGPSQQDATAPMSGYSFRLVRRVVLVPRISHHSSRCFRSKRKERE